ncbi:MAG: hypothetical protein AB1410_00440 [Acidobacteriota bacterium]
MMEEKKSIKIATIILFIVLAYAAVYSLISIIIPDVFAVRIFPGYTGQSWSDFVASSPKLANHHRATARLAGGFALSTVVAGFFVLLTSFKKGEKWSWFCLLFVSLIAWVNSLIFGIFGKDPISITMDLVGLILFIIGIVIPAKTILGKKKIE